MHNEIMSPSWVLFKIQIYAMFRSLGLKYVVIKLVAVFEQQTEARLIWQYIIFFAKDSLKK